MRGTCVAQVAGWQLPSPFSNARPPLSSARPPLPNARPPLFPMLALHFFQRTRANICLNCYFVDFIHYFEEIMFNFGIFTNPGGRYRFGKFHNSKNLETQAFTLGFGLHFTDFYTLFWKNNVCFLIFWESCEALQVWQIPSIRKHWNASVYDRFCIYLAFTLRLYWISLILTHYYF